MIKALRGMRDLMGDDAKRYNYIIDTASRVAKNYGFKYIETPILEFTSLFKRSVGESSDIVGKEMYQFIDKGGNDVCLRPEGTAGVVRAYIQAKLDRQQNRVDRFFYYGPMFRYERPQKGRFREFHQFGVESFGVSEVEEDFTLIQMLSDIFDALNIKYRVKINSLGCKECMPKYRDNLTTFLEGISSDLCQDCQRRVATNPIRVLDCKNESCQNLLKDAPKLLNSLCNSCDRDFNRLIELLKLSGIDFEIDMNLVRGLDYYTKSAFEFVSGEIGAQNAIAGGGRYDRLVEFLGGRPSAGVGFAIGIERIMELLKDTKEDKDIWYLGVMDRANLDNILKIAHNLRRGDRQVEVEYSPKSLKAHLKSANKLEARYCGVIGESEAQEGSIWIKDLKKKQERVVKQDELH